VRSSDAQTEIKSFGINCQNNNFQSTLLFSSGFNFVQTKFKDTMRTLLLFACTSLICIGAEAQTVHDVEVGGGPSGPAPYYAPQFITVEIGDTVRWTNTGGTHNVDGSLATYPGNPEGFRNGGPSSNLWVYDFVFTVPGLYEYECEAFNHADTQFGSITVNSPASINDKESSNWEVYPNPANDFLRIKTNEQVNRITLYTVDMKKVADMPVEINNSEYGISLSNTAKGVYILECDFDGKIAHQKILVN
jgi:plastocyanin